MKIQLTPRAAVRLATIAAASAGLLVLSGCAAGGGMDGMDGMDHSGTGGDPSQSASELAAANEADVAFTAGMIMHHQQAIEMADLVLAKEGLAPEVAALAERIKAAQQPEIDRMEGWLEDWGQSGGGMAGMDHSTMMSADDLAALEAASGPEAGPLFLEQMIVHHEGAVAMAEEVLAEGENADVLALAEAVIADQTEEIAEMREMLGQ
ncbi:DUF305 domain-containing protein [Agromyces mediolanus]|jgi:uncharacterized protein (DUF305 family)|uniref:DUF305 domain-containing protein n=1 Tax=Agromyces mediolanus TaxID=41986 RepID=UPI001E5DB7D1|nr:DUF305 domain-containing protein [Agromyces mediolanus]MCD1570291.1 DUF305 domain-containing protein [Agromyces mediolanus]